MLERVYEIFPKLKERSSKRAGTIVRRRAALLAVGRALMRTPSFLMLDEPFAGRRRRWLNRCTETLGRLCTAKG